MKDISSINKFLNKVTIEESKEFNLKDLFYEYCTIYSRLSDRFGNNIVIKGNIVLNMLFPDYARSTKDIDLDINDSINKDDILAFFSNYGKLLEERGLCYSYKVEEIQVGKSGHLTCYDSKESKVFEVDFNIIHENTDTIIEFKFNDELIRAYKLEYSLADKLSVAFFGDLPRRIKDLYDIYILSTKVRYDIDYNEVLKFLSTRIPDLKDKLTCLDLRDKERMSNVEHAYSKFNISSIFIKELVKPEFSAIYKTIIDIKYKILECLK